MASLPAIDQTAESNRTLAKDLNIDWEDDFVDTFLPYMPSAPYMTHTETTQQLHLPRNNPEMTFIDADPAKMIKVSFPAPSSNAAPPPEPCPKPTLALLLPLPTPPRVLGGDSASSEGAPTTRKEAPDTCGPTHGWV